MMTFDEFMAILQAMDPMQLTLIVALTALLLVLLIVWAIIKGGSRNEAPKRTPDTSVAEWHHGQSRTQGGKLNVEMQKPLPATTQMKADISPLGHAQPESSGQTTAVQRQHDETPQDSVLHRHYLANEAAKAVALHEPYPTDSVLRRHYDAAHKLSVDVSPGTIVLGAASAAANGRVCVPEDSVLKRHFINQLRAEIERGLSPTPSDSVLRRHHDSLVGFELERRLAG